MQGLLSESVKTKMRNQKTKNRRPGRRNPENPNRTLKSFYTKHSIGIPVGFYSIELFLFDLNSTNQLDGNRVVPNQLMTMLKVRQRVLVLNFDVMVNRHCETYVGSCLRMIFG